MTDSDAEFQARLDDRRHDLSSALDGLYGSASSALFERLVSTAEASHRTRSDVLIRRDRVRTIRPDWFQETDCVGYSAYVDRFGGDLDGVRRRLPYLNELGVNVVHLLSLFTPRDGTNDGGFALRDNLRPNPALGTPHDLADLISDFHRDDVSLCVDFVLNHTSDDHEWALAARRGSAYHRDLFITFDDLAETQRYEQSLPEVFPEMAPGNFTYVDELERWVWTTFNNFQWDLNWANPDVMFEMAELALGLANAGIDLLRLDAIAFTWKRLGTNCQNQPEAHLVAQALRAVVGIAAPSTILLAEAIIGPDELVAYLGRHELVERECEIAYHNQLMVQGWSMLATGESRLASITLSRMPDPPAHTTWFTYVRCHDDIGWAIDDADAATSGVSGEGHRSFLAGFYRGDFPTSFARGVPFGSNAATGDERTSGMTASLVGVAAAEEAGDAAALDLAIRRALLLYGIAFGYGGLPMIYMGDEVLLGDDLSALDDPARRSDSRWIHRPHFDDAVAADRVDPATTGGRMWSGLRRLVEVRRTLRPLHGACPTRPIEVQAPHVFGWIRQHPRFGDVIGLANVSSSMDARAELDGWTSAGSMIDVLDPEASDLLSLAPLQVRWLASSEHFHRT